MSIEDNALLGIFDSGAFGVCNYVFINSESAHITIGKNTAINNGFTLIANSTSINIGADCCIGPNFTCYDSNFHSIKPSERHDYTKLEDKPVFIGNNVFIGSNVSLLKGVNVGDNSVIGAGSVVTKSFPKNSLIAGNPAKLIRMIEA